MYDDMYAKISELPGKQWLWQGAMVGNGISDQRTMLGGWYIHAG